jgi:hypothetical protein
MSLTVINSTLQGGSVPTGYSLYYYSIVLQTTCNGTVTVHNSSFSNLTDGIIRVANTNTLVIASSGFQSYLVGVESRMYIINMLISDSFFIDRTLGITVGNT